MTTRRDPLDVIDRAGAAINAGELATIWELTGPYVNMFAVQARWEMC